MTMHDKCFFAALMLVAPHLGDGIAGLLTICIFVIGVFLREPNE